MRSRSSRRSSGAAPRWPPLADSSCGWPVRKQPARRPRRRCRPRRAGERERFDAVRSEVGPAGQCASSVLPASVVSFALISGFRSGRHLTGQAGASHETKVVAALWTTLSVIPSEVEGSAPGRFCAFQRRNADPERRSRGKGKIAWYLGSCPGSRSRSCWISFFLTESTEDTETGFPGLCALCEKPKVQIPRLAALARDDRGSLRSLGMTVSLRSLGMAQS